MIYKCPNCDGALEYNPVSDEMECAHCGGGFTLQEMEQGKQKAYDYVVESAVMTTSHEADMDSESSSENEEEEYSIYDSKETMQFKIYTCTSCGAELAVSDTEVSTYCAYCGQPTIVYSRVSEELKPDYIIPFKITREQAIEQIRKKIKRGGLLTPKAVKNFEIEKVRGIYIPYWLFNVHYRNNQKLYVTEKGRDHSTGYWLTAECDFVRLSCDASSRLADESTQRLEPYNYKELKEFNAAYLSGFYAERYDMPANVLKKTMQKRCDELYDARVNRELNVENNAYKSVKVNHPKYEVQKAKYALFPAWFLTFRYKDEPYTILMNGQTGKIVGAVPFSFWKASMIYVVVAAVIAILLFLVSLDGFGIATFYMFWILGMGVIASIILHIVGISAINKYNDNLLLTKNAATAQFVKERQASDEWRY